MVFRYFWKEMTEDGLLKEPSIRSRNAFSSGDLNNYYGFLTEVEACAAFDEWKFLNKWNAPLELVLIRVYRGER